jgi:hypothetical protein
MAASNRHLDPQAPATRRRDGWRCALTLILVSAPYRAIGLGRIDNALRVGDRLRPQRIRYAPARTKLSQNMRLRQRDPAAGRADQNARIAPASAGPR